MKKGFLSLIALLSIVSCGNNTNNDKLSIACSFAPVYDLAYRIAGDKATITNICGNNEPHEFSPSTAKEVAIAERCDVLFGYGHSIDSWAKKLNTDKYFEITTSNEFENDDPHAWLSLKESLKMLKVVYEKIVELDSSNKDKCSLIIDDTINSELRDKYKFNKKGEHSVTLIINEENVNFSFLFYIRKDSSEKSLFDNVKNLLKDETYKIDDLKHFQINNNLIDVTS